MRVLSLGLWFVFASLLTGSLLCAQTGSPSPELKRLDFLAGDWTTEGTFVPGPPGTPPSKFTTTSHAEWMEGNFFLVENGEANLEGMGKMKELVVMGYDPDEKVYTYRNFNSLGQSELSTGKVDGDTWIWIGDEHVGGMTMKGRVTLKVLSPTSYTTKFELSMDGNQWFQTMEAKSTKN
jgi:Protein of unknown function (DUF1579)